MHTAKIMSYQFFVRPYSAKGKRPGWLPRERTAWVRTSVYLPLWLLYQSPKLYSALCEIVSLVLYNLTSFNATYSGEDRLRVWTFWSLIETIKEWNKRTSVVWKITDDISWTKLGVIPRRAVTVAFLYRAKLERMRMTYCGSTTRKSAQRVWSCMKCIFHLICSWD